MTSTANRTMPSTDLGTDTIVEEEQLSKSAIIKNLAIVSTIFLLCFTSNSGTKTLQSSLHPKGNVGNNASGIQTFTTMVSQLLLSTYLIYKLGLKWSLLASLSMRFTYPASNFLPTWYSLYAGAFISGITSGSLWSSKSTYLTLLAERYALLTGESSEVVVSLFFGIFFMMFAGSMFTGNIISSIVIERPSSTHVLSDDDDVIMRSLCGAHYCYEDLDVAFANGATNSSIDSIYHPTTFQINLLFGIYVVCALLTIPFAAIVDPIGTSAARKSVKVVDALQATVRHMRTPKELLLMPLSLLYGVTFAFITADYSLGFITCSVGIDNVGYVMMVFGGAAGLGAGVMGPLVKYVGRKVIFIFGGLCNAAALIGMLTWSPASHSLTVLCVFTGLWGLANAVWCSQLVSFIAFVFPDGQKEAAFTCNYIWQMGGLCLWNGLSMYMCLYVQIYVIAAILVIGMTSYLTIELMLRAEEAQQTIPDVQLQNATASSEHI